MCTGLQTSLLEVTVQNGPLIGKVVAIAYDPSGEFVFLVERCSSGLKLEQWYAGDCVIIDDPG